MIVAALAPLLFLSLAQAPPSEYQPAQPEVYPEEQKVEDEASEPSEPAEAYPEEEPANGFDDEAADEPDPADGSEAADEAVEAAAEAAEEDSARESEEEEDMVCRRVHYADDFGRQRSRKSCRPR